MYSIPNKKAICLWECNEPWCLADGHADRKQQPAATSHGLAHRLPHRLLHPHHTLLWGLLLSGWGPVLLLPLLPLRLLHLLHVESALLTAGGAADWTSGIRWQWKRPIIPLDRWLLKSERPVSPVNRPLPKEPTIPVDKVSGFSRQRFCFVLNWSVCKKGWSDLK